MSDSSVINKPFGIATLVLEPAEFQGTAKQLEPRILERVSAFLTQACAEDPQMKIRLDRMPPCLDLSDLASKLATANTEPGHINSHYFRHGGFGPLHADEMGAEDYIETIFNIVVAPAQNKMALFNGSVSEWRGLVLQHEFAHGAGAGEPQADKMSALMYRKSGADKSNIQSMADFRAVSVIVGGLAADTPYGWPMVEANDAALAMSDEEIARLTMDDIKAVRFETFDYKRAAVECVTQEAQGRTLQDKAASIKAALIAGAFEYDEGAQRIAQRFCEACARLGDINKLTPAPLPQVHIIKLEGF